MTLKITKPTGQKLVIKKPTGQTLWLITPQTKVPVDPLLSNVSLLLHGNGANGSTTITDSSPTPKTVTAVGNARISTAQSKFGGASIAFDGNGDFLTVPNSEAWALESNDFTIEGWIYIAANSLLDIGIGARRDAVICSTYAASTLNVPSFVFTVVGTTATTGTGLEFSHRRDASILYTITATTAISQQTWHHVAVSRSGITTRLFLNGIEVGSGVLGNQTIGSVNDLKIGRLGFEGYQGELNGYIDELRITKGVARYTANFTPPTAPFPDI